MSILSVIEMRSSIRIHPQPLEYYPQPICSRVLVRDSCQRQRGIDKSQSGTGFRRLSQLGCGSRAVCACLRSDCVTSTRLFWITFFSLKTIVAACFRALGTTMVHLRGREPRQSRLRIPIWPVVAWMAYIGDCGKLETGLGVGAPHCTLGSCGWYRSLHSPWRQTCMGQVVGPLASGHYRLRGRACRSGTR